MTDQQPIPFQCPVCDGRRTIACAQTHKPPGSRVRVICSAIAMCPECTGKPLREGVVPMRPHIAKRYGRSFREWHKAGLRWRSSR